METAAPLSLLIVMLFGASGVSTDSVALLDAADYFKSRAIEVKVDKLLDVAGKDPTDGKTQVAQLLAIRWLGEHPDEAKKDRNTRALLEQIAGGKKAQDPQGFAREYAQRALAQLDGKTHPPQKLPENSLLDALSWFPERSSYFGAIDVRGAGEKSFDEAAVRKIVSANMTPIVREQVFKFVDKIGNVRLDRISFAHSPEPKAEGKAQIYIRISGKGDPQRVASIFKDLLKGAAVKQEKPIKDRPVILIQGEEPPVIAI